MGDRSPKDNLCQGNREAMFDQFLDYVADQRGQLVLLGDVFELLRYPLDSIIARRRRLLDRLARMTSHANGQSPEFDIKRDPGMVCERGVGDIGFEPMTSRV